jgi:RHS repeat-associated protein
VNWTLLIQQQRQEDEEKITVQLKPDSVSSQNRIACPEKSPRIAQALTYGYLPVTLNGMTFDAVSTATDQRNGQTTSFQYDTASGRLITSIIDPRGRGTIIRYQTDGTIQEVVDANNTTVSGGVVSENAGARKTTFAYFNQPADYAAGIGGLLRQWSVPNVTTNGDGSTTISAITTTITGYDKNGKPTGITITDATGAQVPVNTSMVNDALGRLTTLSRTSTTTPKAFADELTTYTYNLADSLTGITDAEQHTSSYTSNYRGQFTAITDPLQNTTTLSYQDFGCPGCGGGAKLTALKDAKAAAANNPGTVYQYDYWGRQTLETDPVNKKIRYEYYDDGLVWKKFDTTGTERLLATYLYNDRGQVTDITYPDGSGNHFTYNPDGTLHTAANAAITYTFTRYAGGPHKGLLQSIADSHGRQITYNDYDALGRRKQITFTDGTDQRVTSYVYNEANRLKTITSAAGTFAFGYDKLGRRKTLSYPHNVTADYSYDDLDRLTGIRHTSGSTTIAFAEYTQFDKVGNRKNKLTPSGTEDYQYDELYRLTQAATPNDSENFSYDAVGNRQSGPGAKDTAYLYNEANQLLEGRTLHYAYDNNGNQTARIVPGATDKSWTQTWDYENRLTRVEKLKGTERKTVTFSYDPFGRRIGKQTETVVDGVTSTKTTSYVYDHEDIVLEITTDGSSTTKTVYTHGPGIDEPLAMERNGSYHYYHADGLGSVTAITDQSKTVVQRYGYDTFGAITEVADPGFVQPYTYTAREWDRETGLYYYRARYYDPVEGRFISRDPIGFAGGDVNLYGYVQNNPVNWTDPSGEYAEVIISDSRMISQGSQFGHVAININGTVYSRAHSGWFVIDASTYIHRQQAFRDSIGLELNTTSKEESIMLELLNNRIKANEKYDISRNSCSSNVADALEQVGIHVYGPWQFGGIAPVDLLINLKKTGRVSRSNWYGKIRK